MSLGKTRKKETAYDRLIHKVNVEQGTLKERIQEFKMSIEYLELKLKYNTEFLEKMKNDK